MAGRQAFLSIVEAGEDLDRSAAPSHPSGSRLRQLPVRELSRRVGSWQLSSLFRRALRNTALRVKPQEDLKLLLHRLPGRCRVLAAHGYPLTPRGGDLAVPGCQTTSLSISARESSEGAYP
jgi:hypothetical protein